MSKPHCRYYGGQSHNSFETYISDSLLHLPRIPQLRSLSALRRWLRALPPHLAAVVYVSDTHDTPPLLRGTARTHAAHASVAHVHLDVLPPRLRAKVGQGAAGESFVVLPPAASAYMSPAGVLAITVYSFLYTFFYMSPNN